MKEKIIKMLMSDDLEIIGLGAVTLMTNFFTSRACSIMNGIPTKDRCFADHVHSYYYNQSYCIMVFDPPEKDRKDEYLTRICFFDWSTIKDGARCCKDCLETIISLGIQPIKIKYRGKQIRKKRKVLPKAAKEIGRDKRY